MSQHRDPLNYGYYAQGFILRPDGKLSEKLGSDGVLFFDQRLGRLRMADLMSAWAKRNGFDAYQFMHTRNGFRNARSVGCMMIVNPAALHAERAA